MKKTFWTLALLLAVVTTNPFAAEDPAAKTDAPATAPASTPATTPIATPSSTLATTGSPANTAAMPKFPYISTKYEQIDDNKDFTDEGMPDATSYDMGLMLELVQAVDASSQEHLKASVDKGAAFKKIFNHPSDFRGHVVQFESTVKFLYEHSEKLTDPNGKVYTLARGHLSSSYQLITFLSVEPLPAGLKSGDAVLLTGVFVQRFAYINRKTPGVELTWTPLILCKRLEPITLKEEAPVNTAWIVGYIFFSLMAVGLFLAYSSRESRRTVRENVFRKIKVQRSGKDRLFPGP